MKKILQRMMKVFVGRNEIRVWQTYDRFGKNWWHAFDPLSGHYNSTDDEASMRAWIERRYY